MAAVVGNAMTMLAQSQTAPPAGWLRDRPFDLTFIVGVAALAVSAGWAVVYWPAWFPMILIANLWLLGYHHVISTYTRAGSKVVPTSVVWRSGARELQSSGKISAKEVADGMVIFQAPSDFEPVELVLWIDKGWAESIPLLRTSVLNPRLALPIDPESLVVPLADNPR